MPTANLTQSSVLNALLTAAMVGLLSWNVYTTHTLGIAVGQIETRMELQNEYTTALVTQRMLHLEAEADKLRAWNQKLSDRLKDVEQTLRRPSGK